MTHAWSSEIWSATGRVVDPRALISPALSIRVESNQAQINVHHLEHHFHGKALYLHTVASPQGSLIYAQLAAIHMSGEEP